MLSMSNFYPSLIQRVELRPHPKNYGPPLAKRVLHYVTKGKYDEIGSKSGTGGGDKDGMDPTLALLEKEHEEITKVQYLSCVSLRSVPSPTRSRWKCTWLTRRYLGPTFAELETSRPLAALFANKSSIGDTVEPALLLLQHCRRTPKLKHISRPTVHYHAPTWFYSSPGEERAEGPAGQV